MKESSNNRLYHIDWIRVIAFDLLIFYHVGMVFVPWSFHIKNDHLVDGLVIPMMFLNQWRLPLLFLISGMGTFYALGKKSGGQFLGERALRLTVPLLFGILMVVPPQIYVERLTQGVHYSSYFDFYIHMFNGAYPTGDLSWHHLWFIFYLFFFTLISIPLFTSLKKNKEKQPILGTIEFLKRHPGLLLLFPIPLVVVEIVLFSRFPVTMAFFGDWFALSFYALMFVYGYLLVMLQDTVWIYTKKYRLVLLLTSALLSACFFISLNYPYAYLTHTIRVYNLWFWILTILGYSVTYLNKPGKLLTYRNQAVYPFYILHQTVLLVLAYYVVNFTMVWYLKFLVLVAGTFGISWLIYEIIIRRFSVFRFLFGMKSKDAKPVTISADRPIL